MRPRHTLAHYRRWLLAQPPERILGERHACYGCPLATYFNRTRHEEGCWVGETTWYDMTDQRHELPPWARQHVHALDRSGLDRITVADALRLLRVAATGA